MQLIITIELGGTIKSFDDVLVALSDNARTITDCEEPLAVGQVAIVFDLKDNIAGDWKVVDPSLPTQAPVTIRSGVGEFGSCSPGVYVNRVDYDNRNSQPATEHATPSLTAGGRPSYLPKNLSKGNLVFETFQILPVVETQGPEFGDVTSKSFPDIASAEHDVALFEDRANKQGTNGIEGKLINWRLFGVNQTRDDTGINEVIADRNTEKAASALLEKIAGPFRIDSAGYCTPIDRLPLIAIAHVNDAIELLEAAQQIVNEYNAANTIDSLATAGESIDQAIEALKRALPSPPQGS